MMSDEKPADGVNEAIQDSEALCNYLLCVMQNTGDLRSLYTNWLVLLAEGREVKALKRDIYAKIISIESGMIDAQLVLLHLKSNYQEIRDAD